MRVQSRLMRSLPWVLLSLHVHLTKIYNAVNPHMSAFLSF